MDPTRVSLGEPLPPSRCSGAEGGENLREELEEVCANHMTQPIIDDDTVASLNAKLGDRPGMRPLGTPVGSARAA